MRGAFYVLCLGNSTVFYRGLRRPFKRKNEFKKTFVRVMIARVKLTKKQSAGNNGNSITGDSVWIGLQTTRNLNGERLMEAVIEIWKLISAPIMGAIAWWNIMLHNGIEQSKNELASHKLHVAENYARKTDIQDMRDEMKSEIKDVKQGLDEIKSLLIKGKK